MNLCKEVIREDNLFVIYANLDVKRLLSRCEPMIKKSGLDWTIVCGTAVMERPAIGRVNAMAGGKGLTFCISAADMR